MSQVGEFPGMQHMNRRTIRAPINPLDKSTIVSIFPKEIVEKKVTMQPGVFVIPPGTLEKPSLLIVGPSSWWRDVDIDQPLLELPVSSIQVADAVVNDYRNSVLASDGNTMMPGIFYVPGEHSLEGIRKDYAPLILKAAAAQKKWFLEQVRIADILWARSLHNPLSISDDSRLACAQLNIKNKEWLGDMQQAELVKCVACGSLRNKDFPICQTCKAIVDPELAKKLNLTFAQ
jgi:hypothetical protein